MRGALVSFEGIEGSGKTTQAALLASRLRALGHIVLSVREPGGTPIGEELRRTVNLGNANFSLTAEAELFLMNASRAQLVRQVIRPALSQGKVILCNRFLDSTTAYQGHGRGLDMNLVKSVIDFAVGDTRPHLTFLLHVPPEAAEARLRSREPGGAIDRNRDQQRDGAFLARVARGYQEIASADPKRVRVIDGTESVEAVSASIWNVMVSEILILLRT